MEITGRVQVIGETEEIGVTAFKKRLLVIETEEKFPQLLPIEFVKDNTSKLDSLKIGDSVIVSINLRGNKYKDKYYPSIQGWKIENNKPTSAPNTHPAQGVSNSESEDSLPF